MTHTRDSTIFWNVDTQYDFMRPDGKLYVPGAEAIEKNLETLTKVAATNDIKVVNTADWHTLQSREISDAPDWKTTFPPHCLQDTPGAAYIPATAPDDPYTIRWTDKSFDPEQVKAHRNIVLYKDEFDAFHPTGAPYTEAVLFALHPTAVFVYGVATNVCVDKAVTGLLNFNDAVSDRGAREIDVYVITDAIKELPNIPVEPIYRKWRDAGAQFTTTSELEKLMGVRK